MLAHNLKETPQAVLVCQQRWHGASYNQFVMHVYMHIYIAIYIYICISNIINRIGKCNTEKMNKHSVYKSLQEYSIC